MTPFRLLLRNLFYHWRGNLAVLLGVVVGAAVLTGALLVGDSLRGSLRDLTLHRLMWIDDVVVGARFFREEAADHLPAPDVSAAILVRGTASVGEDGPPVRQISVLGVTEAFWKPAIWMGWRGDPSLFDSDKEEVVLSKALADATARRAGDEVVLRIGKTSAIPPETLLGRRDESAVLSAVKATVTTIYDDEYFFGNHFNLAPTTEAPRNAFLPLKALQKALGQEGRVNAIFAGSDSDYSRNAAALQAQFSKNLKLDDWGLTVWDPKSRTDALFARLDKNHDNELTGTEWQEKVGEELRPKFAAMIAAAVPLPTSDLPRDVVEEDYRDPRTISDVGEQSTAHRAGRRVGGAGGGEGRWAEAGADAGLSGRYAGPRQGGGAVCRRGRAGSRRPAAAGAVPAGRRLRAEGRRNRSGRMERVADQGEARRHDHVDLLPAGAARRVRACSRRSSSWRGPFR